MAKRLAVIGAVVMGLGTILNRVVVWVNGGAMPITTPVGVEYTIGAGHGRYVPISESTKLAIFADVIKIGPRDFFSVGDVLIYVGMAVVFGVVIYAVVKASRHVLEAKA